uniref:Uncharacterized protein n=1 Tax=Anguilla anguilla TaxID=7936 RepID=A0A0E9V773_ANGAN
MVEKIDEVKALILCTVKWKTLEGAHLGHYGGWEP